MKTFLAIVTFLFLTIFASAGAVWIFKEPIALKVVCPALKSRVSPDECIKEVAVRLSKPALCEKITGADFKFENPPKQECYTEIAARTNDPDLCAKVEGGFVSETQFTCLYRVATRNKNPAACARLEGSESRLGMTQDKDSCFKTIGETGIYMDVDQPKKSPLPIVAGMSAANLDRVAYGLIGLWALAIVVGIAKKAMGKKDEAAEPAKPAVTKK